MEKEVKAEVKVKRESNDYAKNIFLTIVGGVGLLLASMLVNSMFGAPPSRAEFDSLKATTTLHLKHIDDKLTTIKDGQDRILEHLIKEGKK